MGTAPRAERVGMAEYLIFFNDEWVTAASDEGWQESSREYVAWSRRWGCTGSGKAHLDLEATSGSGGGYERGAVGGGDGLHDRQAESHTFAAVGAEQSESLERLKESPHLLAGDLGAGIGHRDEGAAGTSAAENLDVAAGRVVVNGVVHEVDDEAFDKTGIAKGERLGHLGAKMKTEMVDLGSCQQEHVVSYCREVERRRLIEAPFAARQREEGFDEPILLFAGDEKAFAGRAERVCGGVRVHKSRFEQGLFQGERGS